MHTNSKRLSLPLFLLFVNLILTSCNSKKVTTERILTAEEIEVGCQVAAVSLAPLSQQTVRF